jgi:hypothetical protein
VSLPTLVCDESVVELSVDDVPLSVTLSAIESPQERDNAIKPIAAINPVFTTGGHDGYCIGGF